MLKVNRDHKNDYSGDGAYQDCRPRSKQRQTDAQRAAAQGNENEFRAQARSPHPIAIQQIQKRKGMHFGARRQPVPKARVWTAEFLAFGSYRSDCWPAADNHDFVFEISTRQTVSIQCLVEINFPECARWTKVVEPFERPALFRVQLCAEDCRRDPTHAGSRFGPSIDLANNTVLVRRDPGNSPSRSRASQWFDWRNRALREHVALQALQVIGDEHNFAVTFQRGGESIVVLGIGVIEDDIVKNQSGAVLGQSFDQPGVVAPI